MCYCFFMSHKDHELIEVADCLENRYLENSCNRHPRRITCQHPSKDGPVAIFLFCSRT